jgi:hypothetical protein
MILSLIWGLRSLDRNQSALSDHTELANISDVKSPAMKNAKSDRSFLITINL